MNRTSPNKNNSKYEQIIESCKENDREDIENYRKLINDYNEEYNSNNKENNKSDNNENSSNNNSNNNSLILINISNNSSGNSGSNKLCSEIHHKYYHQKYDFDDCCGDSLELFVDLMLSENEYILSGFRLETKNSYVECIKSMFRMHNDTLNIWTHLIGALLYLILLVRSVHIIINQNQLYSSNQNHSTLNSDQLALLGSIDLPSNFNLLFFLFSCFFCFTSSSIYHTFRSHSIPVFKRTLMLDVSSIGLLILSSVCLIIDSELSCFPSFKKVYRTLFLVTIVIFALLLPKIMREKRYGFRTFIFSILALQGLVGHLFRLYLQGFFDQDSNVLKCLLLAYLFIGLGLLIRKLKVPELYAPGKFDIWFSSHQVFHVLVVIGTIQIYNAYQQNYLNQYNNIGYIKQCMGYK